MQSKLSSCHKVHTYNYYDGDNAVTLHSTTVEPYSTVRILTCSVIILRACAAATYETHTIIGQLPHSTCRLAHKRSNVKHKHGGGRYGKEDGNFREASKKKIRGGNVYPCEYCYCTFNDIHSKPIAREHMSTG